MATFQLRRFSSPEILKAISPDRLLAFLEPFRGFFLHRGVALPTPGSAALPNFDKLVDVFMSPDEGTPKELIDGLYYVDEMSTPKDMDDLLDGAKEAKLDLDVGQDVSPADVAVQVWLRAPHVLERKHAEQFLYKPRSFEYFQTDEPKPPPFRAPSDPTLKALEHSLDDWFAEHKRGRTARVFVYPRPEAVWFMARHGEPFKREESVEGSEPSSVSYRPLKHDVLVYDPRWGELRVNAQSKGEKELYRRQFGKHLFGREDFFPEGNKYTLEPIRKYGEACLNCLDVSGIEWVRLREVRLDWGGPHGESVVWSASNLFAAWKLRGHRALPAAPRLARAVFLIKFTDAKRPRTVTIRPPNVALYTRDEDSLRVEVWLEKREFLNVHDDGSAEADDPSVAGP